jgi:hypothetical protein
MTSAGFKRKNPAKAAEPQINQATAIDTKTCANCRGTISEGDKIYECSGQRAVNGGTWCPHYYVFCHECAMELPQHFSCVDCVCDSHGAFTHSTQKTATDSDSSCNACNTKKCDCYGGCKTLSATVTCDRCAGQSAKKRAKLDDKKSAVQAVWATTPLPAITKDSTAMRYAADICNRIYELGAPVPHERLCAALQGVAASYIAFLPKAGITGSTGSTSNSSSSSAVAKK